MKSKTLLVTLALCLATGTVCFAANAQMGTWRLNVKKSKLGGMARNNTVVYSSMVFQTKVTIDGTDEKGKPTHNEWTGRFDGKDYAVTGDPTSDMRSRCGRGCSPPARSEPILVRLMTRVGFCFVPESAFA